MVHQSNITYKINMQVNMHKRWQEPLCDESPKTFASMIGKHLDPTPTLQLGESGEADQASAPASSKAAVKPRTTALDEKDLNPAVLRTIIDTTGATKEEATAALLENNGDVNKTMASLELSKPKSSRPAVLETVTPVSAKEQSQIINKASSKGKGKGKGTKKRRRAADSTDSEEESSDKEEAGEENEEEQDEEEEKKEDSDKKTQERSAKKSGPKAKVEAKKGKGETKSKSAKSGGKNDTGEEEPVIEKKTKRAKKTEEPSPVVSAKPGKRKGKNAESEAPTKDADKKTGVEDEEGAPKTKKPRAAKAKSSKKADVAPAEKKKRDRKTKKDEVDESQEDEEGEDGEERPGETEKEKAIRERKAKYSRKSAAYHRARKSAMANGSSKEEALEKAKAAPVAALDPHTCYRYFHCNHAHKFSWWYDCELDFLFIRCQRPYTYGCPLSTYVHLIWGLQSHWVNT